MLVEPLIPFMHPSMHLFLSLLLVNPIYPPSFRSFSFHLNPSMPPPTSSPAAASPHLSSLQGENLRVAQVQQQLQSPT